MDKECKINENYMNNKENDLLIELRAVPYNTGDSHVLEYRISPNQDLTYYKEHCLLCGLIKFKTRSKYKTNWKRPVTFFNSLTSYKYEENDSWNNNHPIFVRDRQELQDYKNKFSTYGKFKEWYWELDNIQRKEYRQARQEFLNKLIIWN